jgi:hypothetical protein
MNAQNIIINGDTTAYLANAESFEIGDIVTAIAKDENGNPFEVKGELTDKL